MRLRAAVMVFREKREALNALLAEAETLLRPFPEERERLARLVEGPMLEGLPERAELDYESLRDVQVPPQPL